MYVQIKLKLHLLLFYPSTWYICHFFLFHIEIEGKCGWIIGGGGQRVCWPLSQIIGGGGGLPPPHSSYAYVRPITVTHDVSMPSLPSYQHICVCVCS